MAAATKPSAAERTLSMFNSPMGMGPPPDEREVEVLEAEERAERASIPEDADRMRDKAFEVQAWTTKTFGLPQAEGNQYRLTLKGDHYYLESVSEARYCGLMIPKNDLIAVATVFVGAARKLKNEAQVRD